MCSSISGPKLLRWTMIRWIQGPTTHLLLTISNTLPAPPRLQNPSRPPPTSAAGLRPTPPTAGPLRRVHLVPVISSIRIPRPFGDSLRGNRERLDLDFDREAVITRFYVCIWLLVFRAYFFSGSSWLWELLLFNVVYFDIFSTFAGMGSLAFNNV